MSRNSPFEHIGTTRSPSWMLEQGDEREIFLSTKEIPSELEDVPDAEFEAKYAVHKEVLIGTIEQEIPELDNDQLEHVLKLVLSMKGEGDADA